MKASQKISNAISIFQEFLSLIITKIEAEIERGKVKIVLNDGRILYIKYNDFEEYGYQLQFSDQNLDRVRYDNFDANWTVNTHPHHFHPRWNENAVESPMKGDPSKDIPILCRNILSPHFYQ